MTSDTEPFSLTGKRVWVAGHQGMVGSALLRRLEQEDCEVLGVSRGEVDLCRQQQVEDWMAERRPQVIVVAAAKVGGILANQTYAADFIYQNLMIEANIIHSAYRLEVEKLLFLGSSCIYPKMAPQPIAENALLTGPLEPTNQWYAIAKIAGIKLCQAYRQQYGCGFVSAMPTNLYGINDSFDLNTSHVLPALLSKIHQAKVRGHRQVEIWGTGKPRREFLYVDDLADASVFLLKHYAGEQTLNVGTGEDISIKELAIMIAGIVGYHGEFAYNPQRPDGTPRKLLDVSRLTSLGWQAGTDLRAGIETSYAWFLQHHATD